MKFALLVLLLALSFSSTVELSSYRDGGGLLQEKMRCDAGIKFCVNLHEENDWHGNCDDRGLCKRAGVTEIENLSINCCNTDGCNKF
ncbi:hypothetical protein M3Y99_00844000 [Aphelenchoides fujianensis]|nr:hypothetical protein M3Y99_00844000 [Aphelenchoides fujianensis]